MKLPLSAAKSPLAHFDPRERQTMAVATKHPDGGNVRPSINACVLCKLLPEPARSICEALCD
jgi:hypothetical protein